MMTTSHEKDLHIFGEAGKEPFQQVFHGVQGNFYTHDTSPLFFPKS
jgi:hypothetical protein